MGIAAAGLSGALAVALLVGARPTVPPIGGPPDATSARGTTPPAATPLAVALASERVPVPSSGGPEPSSADPGRAGGGRDDGTSIPTSPPPVVGPARGAAGPTPRPRSTPAATSAPAPTPDPPTAAPTPPADTPTPAPETTPTPSTLGADFVVRVSGLTVRLTSRARGATAWAWSFGDGGTSTARNPSHTYSAAGTYTISLTVHDGSGNEATHAERVTVGG